MQKTRRRFIVVEKSVCCPGRVRIRIGYARTGATGYCLSKTEAAALRRALR